MSLSRGSCSLSGTGHNDNDLVSSMYTVTMVWVSVFWFVSGYKLRSLISFLCLFKCQPMAKKRCLSAVVACRAARAAWWVGACDPSWRSVAFHICHAGRSRQNGTCQTDVTHPVLLFSSTRCPHRIPRSWKVFKMIYDFAIAHLVTF